MAVRIDINTDAVVALTSKLERMGKNILPRVVGSTLNALAFEGRKEIQRQYAKKFTVRNKTFIRAVTRVEKVTGFKVNKMISKAGIADVLKDYETNTL